MKPCSSCKTKKKPSEFHKNRSHKNGLQNQCKDCRQKSSRKYKQSETGKTTTLRSVQKYHRLYPEKRKAVNVLNHAIRAGKLTRPSHCESCFKKGKPEGHHEDYSKPLDVEWLCKTCHTIRHQSKLCNGCVE